MSKLSNHEKRLRAKGAELALDFEGFVRACRSEKERDRYWASTWLELNCQFDADGNLFYHGGKPTHTDELIPINLQLSEANAPYALMIAEAKRKHLEQRSH